MLTLLLTTVLAATQNSTLHSANKTITFSGKVPVSTCETDNYSDSELTKLKKTLICPDRKTVTIKKERIMLNHGVEQDIWVIEYEKNH